MPRPLTARERHLLVGTLAGMRKGRQNGHPYWFETDPQTEEATRPIPPAEPEDPTPYLRQVEDLVVVGECGCGDPRCSTVMFVSDRRGEEIVAETIVRSRDERGRIVWVFARDGKLSEMEVI